MSGHYSVDGSFEADPSPLLEALDKSQEGFEKLKGKIAAVSALAETAFGYATNAAANHIIQMKKVADQYDLDIQSVQAFGQAIASVGGSSEAAIASLQRFEMQLGRAEMGGGRAAVALKSMGVSMEELQVKSTEDQLMTVIDALEKIPEPAKRMREAMMLGVPPEALLAFKEGGASLEKFKEKLEERGSLINVIDAQQVKDGKIAVNELRESLEVMAQNITKAVAPAVKKMAEAVEEVSNWFSRHEALTGWIGKVAMAASGALVLFYGASKLWGIIKEVGEATGLVAMIEGRHAAAMAASTAAAEAETVAIKANTAAKQQNADVARMNGQGGIGSMSKTVTASAADVAAADRGSWWNAKIDPGSKTRAKIGAGAAGIGGGIGGAYLGSQVGGAIGGETGAALGGGLGSMAGMLPPQAAAAVAAGVGIWMGGKAIYNAATGNDLKEQGAAELDKRAKRDALVNEASRAGEGAASAFAAKQRETAMSRFARGEGGNEEAMRAAQKKELEEAQKRMEDKNKEIQEHQGAKGFWGNLGESLMGDSAKDKMEKEYDALRVKANAEQAKLDKLPLDHKQNLADSMGEYWDSIGAGDKHLKQQVQQTIASAFNDPLREARQQFNIGQQAQAALGDPQQMNKFIAVAREKGVIGKDEQLGYGDQERMAQRVALASKEGVYQKLGLKMTPQDEQQKMFLQQHDQEAYFQDRRHERVLQGQDVSDVNAEERRAAIAREASAYGTDLTPAAEKYKQTLQAIYNDPSLSPEDRTRQLEGQYRTLTKVTLASQKLLDYQRQLHELDSAARAGGWSDEQTLEAKRAAAKQHLGLSGEFDTVGVRHEKETALAAAGNLFTPEDYRRQVQSVTGVGETRGKGEIMAETATKLDEAAAMLKEAGMKMDPEAMRKAIESMSGLGDTRSTQERIADNTEQVHFGIQEMRRHGIKIDPESLKKAIGEKYGVGDLRTASEQFGDKFANLSAATNECAVSVDTLRLKMEEMAGVHTWRAVEATQNAGMDKLVDLIHKNINVKIGVDAQGHDVFQEMSVLGKPNAKGELDPRDLIELRDEARKIESNTDKLYRISDEGRKAARGGAIGAMRDRFDELNAFHKEHLHEVGMQGLGAEFMETLDKYAPETKRSANIESATSAYSRIQKAAASESSSDPGLRLQSRIAEAVQKQLKLMNDHLVAANQAKEATQEVTAAIKALKIGLG